MQRPKARAAIIAAAAAAFWALPASAVMFVSTGDPSYNTTSAGAPANSGWQWQGDWAGFTGTPISTHYFIAAQHIGGGLGNSIVLNGASYTTIAFPDASSYKDIPNSDLRIWRISGTFPTYAPLWDTSIDGGEVGKTTVVIGRGTERGSEVRLPQSGGQLRGWQWGSDTRVRRWGQNIITDYLDWTDGSIDKMLAFNFDASGPGYSGANEVALSGGDSSGGLFIQSGNQWKLAGVNYGVWYGPWSYNADGSGQFNADLYDASGFYYCPSGGSPTLVPSGYRSYSTSSRISQSLSAITPYLSPTWTKDLVGNWSDSTKWSGAVPSGEGAEASFRGVISTPRTITLDSARTVGNIYFDSANSYTISGSNTLTLDVSSGSAGITVYSGNHKIGTPMALSSNTAANVVPSANILTLSGNITGTGSLTKSGSGTLILSGTNNTGPLNLTAGTLTVASSASTTVKNIQQTAGSTLTVNGTLKVDTSGGVSNLTTAPTIGATAKLDIDNNSMILNYTGASPLAQIRQDLIDGRGGVGLGNATWNGPGGITSTAAANTSGHVITAIGYAENSALPLGSYTAFAGQTVDSTSILIKYTRGADANLDGVVNSQDVTILGTKYSTTITGRHWYDGDFDYNGLVDGGDVTALGTLYNPSAPPLSEAQLTAAFGEEFAQAFELGQQVGSAVPEPNLSLFLMLNLGIWIGNKRRRRGSRGEP